MTLTAAWLPIIMAGITGVLFCVLSYEYAGRRVALSGAIAIVCASMVTFVASVPLSPALSLLFGGAAAWSVTDATTGYIRHRLTVPLLVLCLALSVTSFGLLSALWGVLLCAGPTYLLYHLNGRWHGGGDVMAMACIGAGLGPSLGMYAYVLGALLPIAIWVVRWTVRLSPSPMARMGPYFCAGIVLASILPYPDFSHVLSLPNIAQIIHHGRP
jgi:hypothetical protein